MDLDEVGQRCGVCNAQDYLPRRCAGCSQAFCEAHYVPGSGHRCQSGLGSGIGIGGGNGGGFTTQCPLCNQVIAIGASENGDVVLAKHVDAGCPRRAREQRRCAKCGARDPVATQCKRCRESYCLAHRLELDHGCQGVEAPPPNGGGISTMFGGSPIARGEGTSTADKDRNKAKVNGKGRGRSSGGRKKGSKSGSGSGSGNGAGGDATLSISREGSLGPRGIAAENQFPMVVYFPAGSGLAARHMFFDRRSSTGKVLDTVESLVPGVRGASGSSGERLCLFAVKVGRSVNQLEHMGILEDLANAGQIARDGVVIVERSATLPGCWSVAFGPEGKARVSLENSRRWRKRPGVAGGAAGAASCVVQ